jgi:hypothetical protein
MKLYIRPRICASFCEYDNELSGPINGGEFLD